MTPARWPDDHDLDPPAPRSSNLLLVVVVSLLLWVVFCLSVRSCTR